MSKMDRAAHVNGARSSTGSSSAAPGSPKKEKKKKKKRTFGDETAVAVEKRDRRLEKAADKYAARRVDNPERAQRSQARRERAEERRREERRRKEQLLQRSTSSASTAASTRSRSRSTAPRRGVGTDCRSLSRARGRSMKEIAKDVGDMRRSLAETTQGNSRRTLDSAGGSTLGGASSASAPVPASARTSPEKKKKSRRAFGDEVQIAREKRERKIDQVKEKERLSQARAIEWRKKAEAEAKASDAAASSGDITKDKSSRSGRSFGDEIQKAKEKKERKIEKAIDKEISVQRSKSLSRMRTLSRTMSSSSRSKSCGRADDRVSDEESVPDKESLWRGGKWEPPAEGSEVPSVTMETPPLEVGESSTATEIVSDGAVVGPGMFPRPISEGLVRLDSMIKLAGTSVRLLEGAGLTEEVDQKPSSAASRTAAAPQDETDTIAIPAEPVRRPANPSPKCQAMEEEIARKKAEIVQARRDEKVQGAKHARLAEEAKVLADQISRCQDRVRNMNQRTRFLNSEVNRLRKYNAELVPTIQGLKMEVWRLMKDRDELRKMSYEMADDGHSERMLKLKDWLSDDLSREELVGGEDKKKIALARLIPPKFGPRLLGATGTT